MMLRPVVVPMLVLAAALAVSGCSGKTKEKLEGTREAVLTVAPALKPDPDSAAEQVLLPTPIELRDWGQVGGFADHAPMHIKLNDKVFKAWSVHVARGSSEEAKITNPPVVGEGHVYVLDTGGQVTAVNMETGKVVWRKDVTTDNTAITGGMAIVGGTLYITAGNGDVIALEAFKGGELWRVNVGAPVRAAPTIAEGKVFVVSHNNRLHVLSAIDGTILWTHAGIEEGIGILGGAPPAVSAGVVIAPYSSGEIYALGTNDGNYLWHEALAFRVGSDPYSALVDVEAPPVIVADVVYAVNHNGMISTFNLNTGRRLWEKELSAINLPWVAGNSVFILSDQNQLIALNRKNGTVRWIYDLGKTGIEDKDENVFWTGPVLAGDRLIVVSSEGYAASISPYTGKRLSLVKMGDGISLPPVVAAGTLYFLTNDGDLVAFR
ncbi:MAG: PQQ-binding-like beta-propeller repeat protein [Proteobacteria bacterium]|nr:PQQ-binding-like beta-propeller repeat protein [Pseudomonadota bacterium]